MHHWHYPVPRSLARMTPTLVAANPLAARHVGALIIIVKARHFYDTALAAVDRSAKIAASGVSISVATPIGTLIIGPVTVISPVSYTHLTLPTKRIV